MFRQRAEPPATAVDSGWVDDVLVVSGPNLEAVLDAVNAQLGPEAEVFDAQRSIVGGIAGFFGRELFTVQARSDEAGTRTAAPDTSTGAAEEHEAPTAEFTHDLDGASFAAELAKALQEVDGLIASAAPEPAPDPPAPRADVAGSGTTGAIVPADGPEDDWDDAQGALLALAAPELPVGEIRAHLADLVGTPPGDPDRGVVAVVGDHTDALAVAEMLAPRTGVDPADVLVASPEPTDSRAAWLTVTDADDAARRADRWHANERLTVLAVTMNPGLEGLGWTISMLDALAPSQVRLAVPGWRRAEEVVPKLRGLARVDAIDLCDPVDPAAAVGFLGLPVPVATIAGAPADVPAWETCFGPLDPASATTHGAESPTGHPRSTVPAIDQEVGR